MGSQACWRKGSRARDPVPTDLVNPTHIVLRQQRSSRAGSVSDDVTNEWNATRQLELAVNAADLIRDCARASLAHKG